MAGKWEARLAELKAYREENGDCRVPGTQGNPHQVLGKWASVQRTAYRKKELRAARIAQLEAVDGWLWAVSVVALTGDSD